MSVIKPELLAAELGPLVSRLGRKLRRVSSVEGFVSMSERSVLGLLNKHGALLSGELAVMEKVTPQSMGQTVNRLGELKLIEKQVSPDDKRKVLIRLSEEGMRVVRKVRAERDNWLKQAIVQSCTKEEHALLSQVLGALSKLVEFEL